MSSHFLLSVVIPVFNEEKNIYPLLDRLIPIIKDYSHEIIFVSDGSRDNTVEVIKEVCKHNKHVKLVAFNRNFGHQLALSAGYKHAKGNCVITMDADLQDPPEIIPEMIGKWEEGARIVYAQRRKRDVDNVIKKATARWFYSFINFLSDTPIPYDVGDFRLLDRKVVDFLNDLPEHSRFLRGLVAWTGYPSAYVEFDRAHRHAGETHYTLSKMLSFAFDGITSFSTKPLKLASYAGFTAAILGFIGIIYAIVGRLYFEAYWVTGWTALFVGIMFVGGVQLITIGIVGEYIGKIYVEIQKRPMYIINETVNV